MEPRLIPLDRMEELFGGNEFVAWKTIRRCLQMPDAKTTYIVLANQRIVTVDVVDQHTNYLGRVSSAAVLSALIADLVAFDRMTE